MPPAPSQPRPTVVDTSPRPADSVGAAVVALGFSREQDGSTTSSRPATSQRPAQFNRPAPANDPAVYTVGLSAGAALSRLGVDVFDLLDANNTTGKAGEIVTHDLLGVQPGQVATVVLVGLGAETPRDYRRAGAALVRATRGRGQGLASATSIASLADDAQLAAFVEGLVLGSFGLSRRSTRRDVAASSSDDSATVSRVVLTDLAADSREGVIAAAVARALASWRARAYALTPSNEKGPVQLERWACEAAAHGGLALDVWDDDRLSAEGFGGIVAVGSGSAYESRFLRLDYEPHGADRRRPRVVLVGKGITFDSGGISIKPREAMMSMKRDMTGAGVVIAVMQALRDLDVNVAVTGLVASAENAFGAASMRPGDVVTHYGGRTSEVGNTDAEGRLVLADALAYAAQHIDASQVVDIATLTGAGKVALGTSLGALFANDDSLATALTEAGDLAGEPVWRLPLREEYEPLLENTFADATNAARGPGAITAALFLQHFVADVPWAHLDIASVGDSPVDRFEYTQGATGFGARLLLRWLERLAP